MVAVSDGVTGRGVPEEGEDGAGDNHRPRIARAGFDARGF